MEKLWGGVEVTSPGTAAVVDAEGNETTAAVDPVTRPLTSVEKGHYRKKVVEDAGLLYALIKE